MINNLTLERFIEIATRQKKIVISQEILCDRLTPIQAYEVLAEEAPDAALLESGTVGNLGGRYSYLCLYPYCQLVAENNKAYVIENGKKEELNLPIYEALRQQLKMHRCYSEQASFVGGAVGFLSYDAIRLFENIPDSHCDEKLIPEIVFKFYSTTVVFDHLNSKAIISVFAQVGDDPKKSYKMAQAEIEIIKLKLQNSTTKSGNNFISKHLNIEPNSSDEQFKIAIQKAKKHLTAGDIFQVVLSRNFKVPYTVPAFDLYRAVRMINPSPYMFYFNFRDFVFVGASPEKLVSIEGNKVETCPIAGTRPRGITIAEDEKLVAELLADEKEIAEHVMLVDLARNDIGSVCQPGTVKVTEFQQIHKFSRVMHIASKVEGILEDGKDALDALRAVFPAGTLSGAPKIRAMELIDELELSRRGVYGGAICMIDNQGNLNSCIAIRMMILKDGIATIQAGAGIVFDSDPQKEAEETLHKAKALFDAIELAERGSL